MAEEEDFDDDDLAAAWGSALEEQGSGNADDIAAQWSSIMDEDESDGGKNGSDRILIQDEIDNLMGFKLDELITGDQDGIRALINSALVSYERLPMLEVVFDRLVRLTTTSLRNFTSDNVEVSLDSISSVRFGDYLNSIPLPAILSIFQAKEWDGFGLITIDSPLIYSIIDVLLGGGRTISAIRVDGRPYTTIELNLVEQLFSLIMKDAEAAFEPITSVTFELDRLETNPRFATISRPANPAILVQFRIDMEDRGGKVEFLLPYGTIEPIRPLLMQMFMGEKFGRDLNWEHHLATEANQVEVDLDAILFEGQVPLNQIMNMKIGDTLLLRKDPMDPVGLRIGDVDLSAGVMGKTDERVSIEVNRALKPQKMTLEAYEQAIAEMEASSI